MKSLTSDLEVENKDKFTEREILGQPELWKETYNKVLRQSDEIKDFLFDNGITTQKNINIILTGAGSSAFIGEVAQYAFKKAGYKYAHAIPTTDLVTHFEDLVDIEKHLLLISFGRSGNSPESEAVFDLANKHCNQVTHLVISCNKNGKLAHKADSHSAYKFILPPAAEDRGLAMTGSFTSMILASSLIANLSNLENQESKITNIIKAGQNILENSIKPLYQVSNKEFKRIIFLGDGPLMGCARESHLKVQELSDGACIGKFDSFLGFRHGPKAVIDDESLLVYLISNKDSTKRYQVDLIEQIAEQNLGMHKLAISNSRKVDSLVDTHIYLPEISELPEHFLALPYVLVAQIIGFFKSLALSLDPDNPSRNGAITRVVKGVTIY